MKSTTAPSTQSSHRFSARYNLTSRKLRVITDDLKVKYYKMTEVQAADWVAHVRSNGHHVSYTTSAK